MAKILVIDDDAAMRKVVRRTLADARHEIIEAADGIEGIKSFRAETPAIVVTDIIMPEQEASRRSGKCAPPIGRRDHRHVGGGAGL